MIHFIIAVIAFVACAIAEIKGIQSQGVVILWITAWGSLILAKIEMKK